MPQEMKDHNDFVEDRLVLLKNISGAFRPGILSALMGISGAGKTTLMDVLAGRKTGGHIEGNIMISGYPKKQETFARISGYCEQNDIHSPSVTVHESLLYSAWLRLPQVIDIKTRKMFIDEVMELVELTQLRGALVGLPGVSGLSTEQRKRLTIAVELVANPSVIFMNTEQDILNAMGSMYASVLFVGVQNASAVQPVVAVERTVFYRERAAGMYSAMPYAFAQVAIELPYVLAQAVVYGVIVYAMIGFEWTAIKFFWFLYFMYFSMLYFTFYGMMSVAMTPNQHIATIISSAFFGTWNLFSGFVIPRPRIPVWWRWYYWACPVAWTLYGLITAQFGDLDEDMDSNQTVKEFLRSYFGFRHDFIGVVAAVNFAIPLMFVLLFAAFIKVFNFLRR